MQREFSFGRFFIGLIMLIMGGYLFLKNIHVGFSFVYSYYVGGMRLNTGLVLIPFIFGIGMIFYNPDNDIGWWLVIISIILIIAGVINSINMVLVPMSAFDLMMILGLMIGGLGLFLSSFFGRRKPIEESPAPTNPRLPPRQNLKK
ncbi:hypothetical protein BegalDRAFT_1299 [Beggiatoa alba B18LD]|uniref:Uncharacterized protein n=1 Tax=Beggiatoa alba B18LD TaxID=395493 RepID=I3CF02_9GAMM|nr:hypothetical protein [Beggiatoa alba]EIJ42195.1 hypothetical protein BegalDRAFT_1299 [Beggiatoa alba B18LD]